MSDNWIALIPQDMHATTTQEQLEQAAELFEQLAPELDEIEIISQDKPRLFDCGANLESIECPHCGAQIDLDWWQEQAKASNQFDEDDIDSDEEWFDLQPLKLPCCGATSDLSQLKYTWEQGFSRWGIDAMNPNIGKLTPDQVAEFQRILGCPLKVIYQHI